LTLKLSISGARGIVGESLTPDVLESVLRAYANFVSKGKILLGRDTRPSGEAIKNFVAGYLMLTGFDVVDCGLLPTPTLALCVKHSEACGGIAITASHNPPEWNALKLFDSNGLYLPMEFWSGISEHGDKVEFADYEHVGKLARCEDCVEKHIEKVLGLPYVDVDAIRAREFFVAYDGVGGVAPKAVLELLSRFGAKVVAVGTAMDGVFLHDPEPKPENLSQLSELVRTVGADIGFATDPDGDRLTLVDEKGAPLSEELTLVLAAWQFLENERSDIVVNLSTSTLTDWLSGKFGVRVHRAPVGEFWVSKKMLELGAKIGGEGNGGVIVLDVHPVRDSLTAAALILSLLARTGKRLSEIVSSLPRMFMVKSKVTFSGDFKRVSDEIVNRFPHKTENFDDGVWLGLEHGFLHVRQSNTEPVVRIIAESTEESEAKRIVFEAKKIVEKHSRS